MGACSCSFERREIPPQYVERYMGKAFDKCEDAYLNLGKELEARRAFPYTVEYVEKNCSMVVPKFEACKAHDSEIDLLTANKKEFMNQIINDIWDGVIVRNVLREWAQQHEKHHIHEKLARLRKRTNFDSRIQHKLLDICIGKMATGDSSDVLLAGSTRVQ
mmetsp:Transcript_35824/g.69591  ORF Transcript_35824/g.69591 Transcript_35824/m.69591 type:complete len:161 (+) Transcript_35824:74-556(+)